MIYFLQKYDILLSQYDICPRGILWNKNNSASNRSGIIFSLIFSKKIYHRQSLYHTSLDVYHRFALQIYIIVGWLIPKTNLLTVGFFFLAFLMITIKPSRNAKVMNGSATKAFFLLILLYRDMKK